MQQARKLKIGVADVDKEKDRVNDLSAYIKELIYLKETVNYK